MTIKVIVQEVLPLGGVSGVECSETKIVFAQTNGIYDAFVQANKDEVTKLTKEVREAHTHIHADKATVEADKKIVDADKKTVAADRKVVDADKKTVAADKAQVQTWRSDVSKWTIENRDIKADVIARQTDVTNKQTDITTKHNDVKAKHSDVVTKHGQVNTWQAQVTADKNTVASDKAAVAADRKVVDADKKIVATDKATVAADKAAVASDKTITTAKRNEASDFAAQALASKNSAATSASTATTKATEATTQANRAKSEADRAKTIADGINVSGGSVTGNLAVTGTISEGGKLLSDKYAQITYVDKQIADLKGGASGAYDTLKEIEAALKDNDNDIGTITTALNTKFDKAGGTITGETKIKTTAALQGGLSIVDASGAKLINLSAGHNGQAMIYVNRENELSKNGLLFRSLSATGTGVSDLFKIGMDGEIYAKGNSKVYHAGNKPVWADVGGNDVINITGTYNKLGRGYLCASGDGGGFIPDQSSTTGRSRLGTSSWWFKESFVAKTFTQELNVGDSATNITIKKVGNKLQFLV
ncbi:MAG: hypothetical protein ACRC2Y_05040 [Aeromonas veronii]